MADVSDELRIVDLKQLKEMLKSYLPLDGSCDMTGPLKIKESDDENDYICSIECYNTWLDGSVAKIKIASKYYYDKDYNKVENTNLDDYYAALCISNWGDICLLTKYNGEDKQISIFGEHNYPPVMENAGFHNSVYRGKYLGDAVTDAQWYEIYTGRFNDLYIGDYWTINYVDYVIAAFDYYYHTDYDFDENTAYVHHITLVPRYTMYEYAMNDTDTTEGAYINSKMYTEGLEQAKATINAAFGEKILTHRNYFQNATSDGVASAGSWYDSTVDLMTEQNVYGCKIYGNCLNGTTLPDNNTIDKSQFPLFRFEPSLIVDNNKYWYWLRDVASATRFCGVDTNGCASNYDAAYIYTNPDYPDRQWNGGVRPAFSIGGLGVM